MQNDITFDNIYIGHSIEDAAALRTETFDIKRPIEEAEEEKTKPPPQEIPKTAGDIDFTKDPVGFIKAKLDIFIPLVQQDPIEAIKAMPEVAGGIGGALALVIAIISVIAGLGSSAAPTKADVKKTADKVQKSATDAKDKVVNAAASGAETVKTEVNKRTTRSSGAAE